VKFSETFDARALLRNVHSIPYLLSVDDIAFAFANTAFASAIADGPQGDALS